MVFVPRYRRIDECSVCKEPNLLGRLPHLEVYNHKFVPLFVLENWQELEKELTVIDGIMESGVPFKESVLEARLRIRELVVGLENAGEKKA